MLFQILLRFLLVPRYLGRKRRLMKTGGKFHLCAGVTIMLLKLLLNKHNHESTGQAFMSPGPPLLRNPKTVWVKFLQCLRREFPSIRYVAASWEQRIIH